MKYLILGFIIICVYAIVANAYIKYKMPKDRNE
jgi:hypothetical protein